MDETEYDEFPLIYTNQLEPYMNFGLLYSDDKLGYQKSMSYPRMESAGEERFDFTYVGDNQLTGVYVVQGKYKDFSQKTEIEYIHILGCKVEIWEDMNEGSDKFICTGYETDEGGHGSFCVADWDSFGHVGLWQASSVKCTCKNQFENQFARMVYDRPLGYGTINYDGVSVVLEKLTVVNDCVEARDKMIWATTSTVLVYI